MEGSSITQTLADDLSTSSSSSSEDDDNTETNRNSVEQPEHTLTETESKGRPSIVSLTSTSFTSAASSVCSSSVGSYSSSQRHKETYEMKRLRQALEHCRQAVLMVEESSQIKVQKLQMEIQALRKQMQHATLRPTDATEATQTSTTPLADLASTDPKPSSFAGSSAQSPRHHIPISAPPPALDTNEQLLVTQLAEPATSSRRSSRNALTTRLQRRAQQLWLEQLVQSVHEDNST
jgi:hypothetical protein